jgi:translation initiation factor 2 alpha subunit (eIF-2alpha)
MANLEEGDLILGTVTRIEGTTVFIKIDEKKAGTINFSEVAPGRIRNIREYVMPNKKVVCKVLRVSSSNIDLSLRRVNSRERDEIMNQFKLEQTAKSVLKSLLKENAKEVENKIIDDFSTLSEFFTRAREDDSIINKYIPEEFHEQIKKVCQKRKKEVEVRKIIKLKSLKEDGIIKIKKLFEEIDPKIEITYISAGKFQAKIKEEDYKKANQIMNDFTKDIEQKAKKNFEEFSIEDK